MRYLAYFFAPFPSQEGFSAYRMPGAAVHLPVILMATVTGMMLCLPHPVLKPLLVIWIVAGVYFGRDFAILCHYAPILTLLTWALFVAFIVYAPRYKGFGAAHPTLAIVLSAVLLALEIVMAWKFGEGMRESERQNTPSGD